MLSASGANSDPLAAWAAAIEVAFPLPLPTRGCSRGERVGLPAEEAKDEPDMADSCVVCVPRAERAAGEPPFGVPRTIQLLGVAGGCAVPELFNTWGIGDLVSAVPCSRAATTTTLGGSTGARWLSAEPRTVGLDVLSGAAITAEAVGDEVPLGGRDVAGAPDVVVVTEGGTWVKRSRGAVREGIGCVAGGAPASFAATTRTWPLVFFFLSPFFSLKRRRLRVEKKKV